MKRAARSELKRAHATRRAEVLATLRLVELAEIADAEASARANKPPVEQRREVEVTALLEFLAEEGKAVRTRSIAQRLAMERGLATYQDGYLYFVDPNQQKLPL